MYEQSYNNTALELQSQVKKTFVIFFQGYSTVFKIGRNFSYAWNIFCISDPGEGLQPRKIYENFRLFAQLMISIIICDFT